MHDVHRQTAGPLGSAAPAGELEPAGAGFAQAPTHSPGPVPSWVSLQ